MTDTITKVTASIGAVLLKALVTELKLISPRFTHQNEQLQQEIIDRLRLQVGDQLREAVSQIAANSYLSIPCTIRKVQFKDGAQVQIDMNRTNKVVHDVVDAVGTEAMLVLCNAEQFTVGMQEAVKPIKPQKDAFERDDD